MDTVSACLAVQSVCTSSEPGKAFALLIRKMGLKVRLDREPMFYFVVERQLPVAVTFIVPEGYELKAAVFSYIYAMVITPTPIDSVG